MEYHSIAQASLKVMKILLLQLPDFRITGMNHHSRHRECSLLMKSMHVVGVQDAHIYDMHTYNTHMTHTYASDLLQSINASDKLPLKWLS